MAKVALEKLNKRYGTVPAVIDVDLTIADNEFVVLVGPSGCGKSTTLRMVAGLEDATSGTIRIGERVVNGLAPKDRDIAMVFQNYALYQHMTIYDNLAFGLRNRRVPEDTIRREVARAADILGIGDLLWRKPRQLSGGQQQRVALGRCIVRHPQVFLFDEPLSNLDAKLRVQMRVEIKKLHDRLGTTAIYVTHDQVEAMTLGDRVVVMKDGFVQQVGEPLELYNTPANRFVAGFIGSPAMNFMPAKLETNGTGLSLRISDKLAFPVPAGRTERYKPHVGKELTFGLRPEHITEPRGEGREPGSEFTVNLDVVEPMGMETMVFFTVGGTEVCSRVEPTAATGPGQPMRLYANLNHMHLIDASDQVL